MFTRICFAYYWATSGGVERVFLNRSEALLRRYPELEIDVYFYNDLGGAGLFTRYSKARNLDDRLRVIKTFDPARYDVVLVVDTPQFLTDYPAIQDKVLMECHTPYAEHRTYLREWQTRLKSLVVPSSGFLGVIESECPSLRGKVKVVSNFVPHLPEPDRALALPAWRGSLFLYFSQINLHKNVTEFIQAVSYARRHLRMEPLGIVCGQRDPGYPLPDVIDKNQVRGSIVILPPVPFQSSHVLMQMMRKKRAVFVSCSKGESFGLSAAEAMTAGLPVILSDIPPHATLVSNRAKFLYPLGDVRELSMKMAAVTEQYDELAAECVELSHAFSEETFLADWERLFTPGMQTVLGLV
jgi:glycosyltransferase involved in cell wall biosynthesis